MWNPYPNPDPYLNNNANNNLPSPSPCRRPSTPPRMPLEAVPDETALPKVRVRVTIRIMVAVIIPLSLTPQVRVVRGTRYPKAWLVLQWAIKVPLPIHSYQYP